MSLQDNNSKSQSNNTEEYGYATEKPHFFREEGKQAVLSVNAVQRDLVTKPFEQNDKESETTAKTEIKPSEKQKPVSSEKKALIKADCQKEKQQEPENSTQPESKEKTEKAETKNQRLLRTLKSSDIKTTAQKNPKINKGDMLRRALMTFFAAVIAISAINIVYQTVSKYIADEYYDRLRDNFYSDELQTDNVSYLLRDTAFPAEERLYSDEGDVYSAPDLEILGMHEKYERMLPKLQALKKENSNVFAWIKVEGTRVDYPVVRSPQGNNDYYLDHALDRTYSVSGSVFMDYANSVKLSGNRNTCIYGHNMNDGTMFQTIMNFRTRNQFLNGQIEVYTADGIYIYTPFAVYDAVPTERFFHTQFADDADFASFLEDITSKSIFSAPVVPEVSDKVITLITCTNTVTDKRFVVHGVLTDIIK